jgi:hypothetical protein
VRLLAILVARAKDVEPDTQVGDRQELEIRLAGRRPAFQELGDLVGIHVGRA